MSPFIESSTLEVAVVGFTTGGRMKRRIVFKELVQHGFPDGDRVGVHKEASRATK